jgi:ADP-heptose:LPS heptosyltransferase
MKILILQISALGDIIYTLFFIKQLFYSLKNKFENVTIDWLVKNKNILLENQSEINCVIYDKKNIIDDYDYVIDFGTKRSTCFLKYKLSGIKIGFTTNKIRKFFIPWLNDYSVYYNSQYSVMINQRNMVEFICKIHDICLFCPKVTIDYNIDIIQDIYEYCKPLKNIVLFNPNASTFKKEVSLDTWYAIFQEYRYQNKTCILVGEYFGEKGKILAEVVRKDCSFIHILPKNLDTFYNLSYLISKCECVYTPDTSILHLAEFQKIHVHELFTEHSNPFVKKWRKDKIIS